MRGDTGLNHVRDRNFLSFSETCSESHWLVIISKAFLAQIIFVLFLQHFVLLFVFRFHSVCRPLNFTRVYTLQPFYYYFTDIDYCINHTCLNGASCVDGLHNYTCKCPTGFKGSNCETGRFFVFF